MWGGQDISLHKKKINIEVELLYAYLVNTKIFYPYSVIDYQLSVLEYKKNLLRAIFHTIKTGDQALFFFKKKILLPGEL